MTANLISSILARGRLRGAFSRRGLVAAGCILSFGVAIADFSRQKTATDAAIAKCNDAVPAAERDLALRKKDGAPDDPELFDTMITLSQLYVCAGRYLDAFDLNNQIALIVTRPMKADEDPLHALERLNDTRPSLGSRLVDVPGVHLERPLAVPPFPGAPR
jgi:hypothetical protein